MRPSDGAYNAIPLDQLAPEEPAVRWGDWVFDPKLLTLAHVAGGYEIDLEEVHSSAAILDWIFQLQHKAWADARTMHDLLRAIDAVLCPQANYCSREQDLRVDGGQLAREYAARVAG
jgi:hypothetical protein